jgi:hypothetical protein
VGRAARALSAKVVLALLVGPGLSGCLDDERSFTQGRLETLCEDTIPVCGTFARCTLGEDEYVEASFPGGLNTIVRSDFDRAEAVVRVLLTTPTFAGSEIQVRLWSTACATFDELRLVDTDLFEIAAPTNVLEAQLEVDGRGDHLLEIFSDAASGYLVTVALEERAAPTD